MVEKRGRKAAADVAGDPKIVPIMPGDAKPPPPDDVSESEAIVWRSIVDSMPSQYFGRESWPVLRGLCAHMVAAEALRVRYLAAVTSKKKPSVIAELAVLYNRETQAVRFHSADLRLTKVTRIANQISADRKKNNQVLRRPWDD